MRQASSAVKLNETKPLITNTSLRPASEMMSEYRISSAINNPLSFSRTGMRELLKGNWRVIKDRFDLDADGRGEVLYRLTDGEWEFHFYLLSNKLPEEQKLDRNFAGTWEAMGVLCEGPWTAEREAHLRAEIPKQVAGRSDYNTLIYVRGNRSGRLFQHVVDSLAQGCQPDAQQIASVGYILRTTAFIGNGQLGTRPLAGYDPDHPMRRPYHAQIWSAFMLREYVFDLVEHMARAINPQAARLNSAIRRYLGLGNSAATGLVPFIANHPMLIDRWVQAQEAAMAQARSMLVEPTSPDLQNFKDLLAKSIQYFSEHHAPADGFFVPSGQVAQELECIVPLIAEFQATGKIARELSKRPWLSLHEYLNEAASGTTVEVFNAIVLDLYPEIIDLYCDAFMGNEQQSIDASVPISQLEETVREHYDWVIQQPSSPESEYYFWYRAEAAPFDLRRGVKGVAPDLESETPMDTVRLIRELLTEIKYHAPDAPVLDILLKRPDLRQIIRRVQSIANAPYGELRINLLSKSLSPFGPVRFVLSFYGMEKFEGAHPKVVRGAFLQGAPIAEDVERGIDGSWPFPLIPSTRSDNLIADVPTLPPQKYNIETNKKRILEPALIHDPDWIISAPIELTRLIQSNLHGAGLEMGEAIEVGELIIFHEAMNAPAYSFLPEMLSRQFKNRQMLQTPLTSCEHTVKIDAQGLSIMALVCNLVDWATTRAADTENTISTAIVHRCDDAHVMNKLPVRCAEHGQLAILVWRTPNEAGITISGPSDDGPWLVQWNTEASLELSLHVVESLIPAIRGSAQQAHDVALIEKLTATLASCAADTLTRVANDQTDHITLICARTRIRTSNQMLNCLARNAPTRPGLLISIHSPHELARTEKQWHRQGIKVKRQDFANLSTAARALLIPNEQEYRLRPGEVIDPLKIF